MRRVGNFITALIMELIMPILYINRKNQTCFLIKKETKTGKSSYVFSMKQEGVLVEKIPEGYEIYEHPNARVFLRKITPKLNATSEKLIIEQGLKKISDLKFYAVDIKGDTITVYF